MAERRNLPSPLKMKRPNRMEPPERFPGWASWRAGFHECGRALNQREASDDRREAAAGPGSNTALLQFPATEETRIVRQTIRYKGGQVVNGQLGNGKFTSATIATETRPPSIKSAMWLLERRFPQRRGRQAGGELRNAPLLLYSHRPTMGVLDQTGQGTTAQTASRKAK